MPRRWLELRRHLGQTVDPAGLVAFRVGFGLLLAGAALRFELKGWVQELLVAPAFHFAWAPWARLPWGHMPPEPWLHALFALQVIGGLALAAGWLPRLALSAWLLGFGAIELLDKALYLNHYVLLTLLGATLLAAPWGRLRAGAPRWLLLLLRAELGLVYLWAGLAKLNADWLLRGEPLHTWLGALVDLPVLGPWLAWAPTAVAMSWAGAAYDLSVPFLLLHPRTRALGLLLVLGFHSAVGLLFPIGVFPWVMVLGASLFCDPSWPRRWLGGAFTPRPGAVLSSPGAVLWLAALLLLTLWPGRGLLREGSVSWHERGHRFAWRVLLNQKSGLVDYVVVEPATGRRWTAHPAAELTPLQHEQLRTQPDLIRDYALHLAAQHLAEGREVAVYAEAWASLNGRPAQRLLRADLDLTRPLRELDAEGWILPLKER